jgi:hypothetical protein
LFQLNLVLLSALLMMYSYRCCFFPGFSAMARVSAVAAFPTAELSSATGVCNIPGVPAVSFTAFVGFPLVLGLPDVVDFPAVAG